MSTNTQRITAVESDIRDIKGAIGDLTALTTRLVAFLDDSQTATVPPATKAPAKTEPTKAYRSAKGKEQAKADVAALWTKTLKAAGAKRAKDLTPAQMDAYRAQSKAIWAAVPKTRSTKA